MSTSAITPSSTGATPNTNSAAAAAAALGTASQLGPSSFMTLLVAQLKSQDPSNPMDPTAMVTQLVQFNSLEQLIQINQNTTAAGSTQSTAGTTSGATASSGAAPTTTAAAQSASNLNLNVNSLSTNSQANS